MVRAGLQEGILGRAVGSGLIDLQVHDLRDFTTDRHKVVDDAPFGGGPGMVLKPEPIFRAVESILAEGPSGDQAREKHAGVILLSPQGRIFNQAEARRFADEFSRLILICGRYEGVDERVAEHLVTDEISIGDYVLTGGEIPAMVVVDAVTRLLPNALGSDTSALCDSFSEGLLDYPHYTRPETVQGLSVPRVLLEGHHAEIARWRRQQALGRTACRRPDLFDAHEISAEDRALLEEFLREQDERGT